ncbi:MAG: hypothetical protein ABH804_02925 [archaeon]
MNATIKYDYAGGEKERKAEWEIEEGSAIPILEVVRETPTVIGTSTEFVSKLAVYNKGCADASTISLTEKVGSGWIAYTPSIDNVLGGIADIPRGEIRYTTSDLETIRAGEYKVLSYLMLSPSELNDEGTLRYNLTWGSRNKYESSDYELSTFMYANESRLFYSISTVDSFKHRSAEANDNILYEFNVTNVGDLNIANSTWNVSLSIPVQCEASNFTGSFNDTTRKIMWNLGSLNVGSTNSFYFNLNCTEENKYVLRAEGINDTRASLMVANGNAGLGCSGASCDTETSFTFTEPSELRYKEHSRIDMKVYYEWTGYRITVGEGLVGLRDASGNELIQWQNYSLNSSGSSGTVWVNYTLDESEKSNFQSGIGNFSYDLHIRSYTNATSSPSGNVTVVAINNLWDYGKLFNETQDLFIDIHSFIFDLPTPVLQTPLNDSLQAATPIGLSWEAISAPGEITITYYVYGDDTDASTLLETTTENLYLWRELGEQQGVFYWKIIASDGTSNATSEVRQFTLDTCQPNPNYAYASNYPMGYDEATDTITVWGSNGSAGKTPMGNNESSPIIFERIFEFGQAARGICAVTKPASGTYAVLSRLELGNVTDALNTTFVKTTGESISFSKQIQLNFNATLISGQLTSGGSPFAGSTLSFSGLDATDSEEGQFYLKDGSKLRLYNTGVSHTIDANNSAPFRLYWNGDTIAKASTLQNWYTVRFLGSNNTIDNLILTNMGEGFFPASTQVGTLTNIKPSGIQTGGLVLEGDSNVIITGLEIAESGNDVLIISYNGTTNLINPVLNFSNLNWTEGSFDGSINRKHTYLATVTDSTGAVLANTTLVLIDVRGDVIFSLTTDSNGQISSQTITRAIYDYAHKTGDERGPHLLLVKKFQKRFQENAKSFSAATVETLQVSDNGFSTLSEAEVLALTGLDYYPPTKVSYGEETNSSWTTAGQLAHYPVDSCQYYALFANGTKLVEGTNYSLNKQTGLIGFDTNMDGYNVSAVYYYGGSINVTNGITIANAFSLNQIYDFMQYETALNNLSEELTTVDGLAYQFCVDLSVGNETDGGSIQDASKTISFNPGYDVRTGEAGAIIDLAGVGGAGIIGAIQIAKAQVIEGEWQTVYVSMSNDLGQPLTGRNIYGMVHYPNGSIWIDATLFEEVGDFGLYKFEFQIPVGHAPFGVYAAHITSIGVNEVRVFEYIPESDIIVRDHLDTNQFLDWVYAPIMNSSEIWLYPTIENQHNYALNLSQYYLWNNNYFFFIGGKLKSSLDAMMIYEEEPANQFKIDRINETTINNWTYSGDIFNISLDGSRKYEGSYSINITLNYSTGIGAVSRNFSSVNLSSQFSPELLIHTSVAMLDTNLYLPDLVGIKNISMKLKTDEENYYLLSGNLSYWKIHRYGWNSLKVTLPYDAQEIGVPDMTDISGYEVIFEHNYTTPTRINLDNLHINRFDYVPWEQWGFRDQADGVTVYWWNGNQRFNINALESRNAFVKIYSPQYEYLTMWHNQYPNDAYITQQYNAMMNAEFYYEHWIAEEKAFNYLQALPEQLLYIISSLSGSYTKGDVANLNLLTTDISGALVSSSVFINITYPNGTTFLSGTPTEYGTGRYNYTFIIPTSVIEGDYLVKINANYSGRNASDIKTFSVLNSTSSDSGGLPLSIMSGVGSKYAPGETVYIISTAIDSSGNLVNASVSNSLYYPNGSFMTSGEGVQISEGRTRYNYTLPSNTPEGDYYVVIDAEYLGNTAHENLVFQVGYSTVGAGGLALNMFNSVGSIYSPGNAVRLFTTTVNSSGALVNSTVDANVYYPNGSLLNSGESDLISAGRFEYNFTAPIIEGTYRIEVDANYSDDEAHSTEAFVVAVGGAGGEGDASVPRIQVEAPAIVSTNTNFSITTLSTNENGYATSCNTPALLTIKNLLTGENFLSGSEMTNFGTGLYNYTYSVNASSSYLAIVECTILGVPYYGIKSFSTQGVPFPTGNYIELTGYSEVLTEDDYKAKLYVFDLNGVPVNADTTPKVTLYDASGNTIVEEVSMTPDSTGTYSYSYTTSSGQIEGNWETNVTLSVNGINYQKTHFWKLMGGIFDVRDITIINPAVDGLQISVVTENVGGTPKDLYLEWQLRRVDTDELLRAGADTFAVGAFSERVWTISPTISYVGEVEITFVGTPLPVGSGDRAGAYTTFSTTEGAVEPPVTPPSAGGSSGGVPTPSVIVPIPTPEEEVPEVPEEAPEKPEEEVSELPEEAPAVCKFKFIFCWYWWIVIILGLIGLIALIKIIIRKKIMRITFNFMKSRRYAGHPRKIKKIFRKRREGEDLNKLVRYIKNK